MKKPNSNFNEVLNLNHDTDHEKLSSMTKDNKSFIFWSFFFITIIVMGIGYFIAIDDIKQIQINENGKIVVTEEFVKHFEKCLPQTYQYIDENMAVNAKNDIDVIINEELDRAFKPVYNQIQKFSDFHYSLSGEYTEIITALSGKMSQSVKKHLFDDISFDSKLQSVVNNIITKSNTVFSKAIDTTHNNIKNELNMDNKEFLLLSKSFIEISIDDMQKRFSNFIVDGIRTGGVATGFGAGAVGTLMAKKISGKIVAKLAIKISAKLGIKGLGGASTAATGGGIGFVLGGPVGAAIGGVVGGVAGWIITDKIIVEIDQYFNEEDFKLEMRQLVSQEKQAMKDTLKVLYGKILDDTTDDMKSDIKNMKLKDYINNSN